MTNQNDNKARLNYYRLFEIVYNAVLIYLPSISTDRDTIVHGW